MLWRATQNRWVKSSDKTWSTGEANSNPLHYSCLENPMDSMKRQKKIRHRKMSPLGWKDPLSSSSPPAFNLPSIRVFSNELVFLIRWPKYWNFSFSISPLLYNIVLYRWGLPVSCFLPFHTVHGVLQARTLEWVAISFSSGPDFVRTPPYDPCVLGGPAWLLASLSYTSPFTMTKL